MKPVEKLKTYVWGMLAGFTIAAFLLIPRWQKDVAAKVEAQSQLAEVMAALEKQIASTNTCVDKLEAGSGGITVVFEPTAPEASAVAVRFAAAQFGVELPPTIGLALPRWVIPGRVRPVLVGPPNGEVFYFFVETGSGRREGPFTPEAHQ